MPLLLVILFIVVPIAELYVIIQIGQLIGVWWTIALLLADSVIGSWLMRSQGRAAWRRFNAAIAEGRPPAREALDEGCLVIFGPHIGDNAVAIKDALNERFRVPAISVTG